MCKFTPHTSLSSPVNCPMSPLSPAKGPRVLAEDCSGHLVLIPDGECPHAEHVSHLTGTAFHDL